MDNGRDIVERLRKEANEWDAEFVSHEFPPFLRSVADLIESQEAEILRLRSRVNDLEARLEIDHCWKVGKNGESIRVEIPPEKRDDFPDGILCRNETIKLLKENVERLRSEKESEAERVLKLREAAEKLLKFIGPWNQVYEIPSGHPIAEARSALSAFTIAAQDDGDGGLAPLAANPDNPAAIYRAAVSLIREGKNISAMRQFQTSFGITTREAKALVEAIVESLFLPPAKTDVDAGSVETSPAALSAQEKG